ncbi:hypothetical protein OTU49_012687, partial [Cherax quadricarinatus]
GPYCPYPYKQVLDECFHLSTHRLTWNNARQHCQGMMGDLASPKNLYALKTFIIDETGINSYETLQTIPVFVGGADEGENRQFKWVNGEAINSSNWAPGEPNNKHNSEFCVEMFLHSHPSLNDESCVSERQFVCQYHPPKTN